MWLRGGLLGHLVCDGLAVYLLPPPPPLHPPPITTNTQNKDALQHTVPCLHHLSDVSGPGGWEVGESADVCMINKSKVGN